jgi:hypothetical protein
MDEFADAVWRSYACCVQGCGGTICFDDALERRLRRTHEEWSCPFGHQQHFTDLTEDQERIERLEAQLGREREWRRDWMDRYERVAELFGTCPVCGWRTLASPERKPQFMLRHYRKDHPGIAAAFEAAIAAEEQQQAS